jgi:hypothetical protein
MDSFARRCSAVYDQWGFVYETGRNEYRKSIVQNKEKSEEGRY